MLNTILKILVYVLTSVGIYGILKKMKETPWWAFIPGLRYYGLSRACEREQDGKIVLGTEIILRILGFVLNRIQPESNLFIAVLVLVVVLIIINVIYIVRVVIGVLHTFDLPQKYAAAWVILPFVFPLILGFNNKYQPVYLGQKIDDELLAGTAPASLTAALDDDPGDDGLVVHVRARKVNELSRFRATRYLLKDINLTIPNGTLVLLLGGSGSGKTTLINAINGYEKADAKIMLNGRDIYKEYGQMKYRIGFVPQQELLRMNDTVIRTLRDAADLRLPKETTPEEKNRIINDVMDTLGLTAGKEGLVSKKSGGMKKRISIGTELISDPDLFILDEPDSGLDGVIARELFERLREIADRGKIVLVITHTPDRVIDLFDKVIVLARDSGKVGRLAFYGSPDEARAFFERDTMERILMCVNKKEDGGEGRADEFIEKYAQLTKERGTSGNE